MAFDFDHDAFFNLDEFAQVVTYTPVGGVARPFNAIFDVPDANVELAGGSEYESSAPKITCKTSDVVADVTHGAAVAVGGKSYKVVEVSHDGTGISTLTLSEDSDG